MREDKNERKGVRENENEVGSNEEGSTREQEGAEESGRSQRGQGEMKRRRDRGKGEERGN